MNSRESGGSRSQRGTKSSVYHRFFNKFLHVSRPIFAWLVRHECEDLNGDVE